MTRVAFLVAELGRSGGMAVIRERARHLREHEGVEAELVVCGPKPGPLAPDDDGIPVRPLAGAPAVDVAIATWWTTAECLWELNARRRAVYLQNLEMRFYGAGEVADRMGAFGVLDLPVDYLVIATHMRELLADLRPDARVRHVPIGIDKRIFARAPARAWDGTLRVLVEGQPTLWFKGVHEAVAAVRAMRAPATVTVATHEPADLPADRVVSGLSAREMAALYAEHDVLLKLSRFEGLGLPPLESFHVGVPCVLTPFTGGEDYVRDEENALVVGFDEPAAPALDRLAGDPELRARLREGALRTAAAWPDRETGSRAFAAAVRELLDGEPPSVDAALRRMLRGRRLAIELGRQQDRRLDAGPDWKAAYEQADAKVAEYDRWTRELRARIEALQRRPGFRVEEKLKGLRRR